MQHVAVGMTRKQITKQAGENTSNLKVEEIVHGKITCKNIAYCFLR
jgi:tRNA A-37 threonylcarbamoyl transferase component Bud32